ISLSSRTYDQVLSLQSRFLAALGITLALFLPIHFGVSCVMSSIVSPIVGMVGAPLLLRTGLVFLIVGIPSRIPLPQIFTCLLAISVCTVHLVRALWQDVERGGTNDTGPSLHE